MEIIPLAYIKNRKTYINKGGENASLDEVLKNIDKDKEIYFLDIDGIEKNKPNLCTYQKISEKQEIWVDTGPRNLGDVVDLLMAGANKITIREQLYPIEELPSIKEVTENKVYTFVDLLQDSKKILTFPQLPIDGLVFFLDRKQIEADFKREELLKSLCNKYNTYVAEGDKENITYWGKIGAAGVLLDLKTYKDEVV